MPKTSPRGLLARCWSGARPSAAGRAVCVGALAWAMACTGGCGSSGLPDGPAYPALAQGRVMDVQVVRRETTITLTNTTAQDIPACRMWINGAYSRMIDPLPIGATTTLPLGSFRDRFESKFKAGGFFATENPDTLVQAQLELDGTLVGLLVIGQTN